MDKFLSCDWGTSSFRLRLISLDDLHILAEENSADGIAGIYRNWEQQKDSGIDRDDFYINVLRQKVNTLSANINTSLERIPIVLSGMASSTIGLIDLPYKRLPFSLRGDDLEARYIDKKDFNPLLIISGASTADDVMRGEETKIIGCHSFLDDLSDEHLLIFPGTHPKHINIQGDKVTGFNTYMTGEFFDLLSNQSILAASVSKATDILLHTDAFKMGVEQGLNTNLLHAAFMVRTNQVLKAMPKDDNFCYLSGLLIGAELKSLNTSVSAYLVGGKTHIQLYNLACRFAGITLKKCVDADEALIRGQQIILSKYLQS